jgi:hypothetical protein
MTPRPRLRLGGESLRSRILVRTSQTVARTARTVDGYQRAPPCAVPTPSRFRPLAIAARLKPRSRSRRMRVTTLAGRTRGRPSLIPCAFFTASASRVRWPMISRSHCAAEAITDARNLPHTGGATTDQRPPTPHPGANRNRTAGRHSGRRRTLEQGDRRRPVHGRGHRRETPHPRLPQTRRPLTHPATPAVAQPGDAATKTANTRKSSTTIGLRTHFSSR